MAFIKSFLISPSDGLTLLNTSDRDTYLQEKIQHFSIFQNYSSKAERIGIIQEILNMYQNDYTTALIDTIQVSGHCFFDINKHREIMLMYYDIIFLLGTIVLNVFDKPGNRLHHVEEGLNGPVSTAQMFLTAYSELEMCKASMKVPYGANLIFTTLLEKDLKLIIKNKCAREWLSALEKKIQSGTTTLSADEMDYFEFLRYNYELTATPSYHAYDGVVATTTAFYDLLINQSIIGSADTESKNLLLDQYTLNQFLNANIAQTKIEPPYLELIKLLFGTKKLNLKNNLAHCNYGYLNYHTICVAALMFLLFNMVSSEQCLI